MEVILQGKSTIVYVIMQG